MIGFGDGVGDGDGDGDSVGFGDFVENDGRNSMGDGAVFF